MNRFLVTALFASLNVVTMSAQAQSAPPINPNLKQAVTLIPIPGIKEALNDLFGSLKQASAGGDYSAKTTVSVPGVGDIPLQLYFFGDADKQAILLVVNRSIGLPNVFKNRAWKRLAGATLTDPIFAFSTVDFSLSTNEMSADLKKIVANSYFNVDSLDFTGGFQVASKVSLGGVMKNVIETGMGVPVQNFTMRAGVVLPVPSDTAGRAAFAASMLAEMMSPEKKDKEGEDPEFFAEFQLAPGKTITGPIGMGSMKLSDATLFINNKETVGYKGNVTIAGGKKFITFFETPLNPAGAMDLVDFKFGLTAQKITLEDYVNAGIAFSTTMVPGGNFIKDLPQYQDALKLVLKPLSVFQLRNPKPVGEYKFGDKTKPFPPMGSFNLLVLGPLASVDDADGKTIHGPLFKAFGNATILGQEMGTMNVYMGASGLRANATAGLTLKLGPLGKQGISMAANVDVSKSKQLLELHGNVVGRTMDMVMSPTQLSLSSPATCLTPFALSQKVSIESGINVGTLLDALPGVNVDPAQITGCFGEDLQKALTWVSTTGSALGGYTADAANKELKKMANAAGAATDAAADAAKKQEEAARKEYNKAKDAARDKADKSINEATSALNDAGNSIKKLFGKKKHKDHPDTRFDRTVFDWDYYYDRYPDLVKHDVDLVSHWRDSGFNAGRQGSLEFSAKYYLNRYLDLQQACPEKDYLCALNHWLEYGISEGRQGSADFNVASYLNRYSDLQKAFGKDNYPDALDHWLDSGKNAGRNGSADSVLTGSISGPRHAGGGGGGAWSDNDKCAGQYVTGFRLRYGGGVDAVQFHYGTRGWAEPHGYSSKDPYKIDVTLPKGDYIVGVDYRSGSRIDSVSFKTKSGKTYGPYGGGGGGSSATYTVTPGEKLACMSGRAGSSIDQLIFSSTGPR